MALSKRVSVAVSPKELAALKWVARQLLLQRRPHYSKTTKRPGAGGVLRLMTVADAVVRYEQAMAQKKPAEVAGIETE